MAPPSVAPKSEPLTPEEERDAAILDTARDPEWIAELRRRSEGSDGDMSWEDVEAALTAEFGE